MINWRRVGAAYLRARLAQGMDEDSIGLFHGGVSSNSGAGSRIGSQKVEQRCSNCSPRPRRTEHHVLRREDWEV